MMIRFRRAAIARDSVDVKVKFMISVADLRSSGPEAQAQTPEGDKI